MLYWPGKMGAGMLEEELMQSGVVTEISIVSAYLSDAGIDLVERLKDRYVLDAEKIEVILSSEFSAQSPGEKLARLLRSCRVRILHSPLLHAKAYWLHARPSKLVMGSSNLTQGGLGGNIELDQVISLDAPSETEVRSFFNYCRSLSDEATQETVQLYRDITPRLDKLRPAQDTARRLLRDCVKAGDPFHEGDYDLTGTYFTYRDYETLFPRNQKKTGAVIRSRREELQDKMLAVHRAVYPEIQKLGVACHYSEQHITSLIRPCQYNHGKVAWIGVRYGKTHREIKALNTGTQAPDEEYGFQKHGCLQFCLGEEGFSVELFHAVRHGAVDRDHLHSNLKRLAPQITAELRKLQGRHMVWYIQDELNGFYKEFHLDDAPPEDFIAFYRENDHDGCESFLDLYYSPGDPRIRTLDGIKKETIENMELLRPLYNAMVYRPKI